MRRMHTFEVYTKDGTLHGVYVAPTAHMAKRKAWAVGAQGPLRARRETRIERQERVALAMIDGAESA